MESGLEKSSGQCDNWCFEGKLVDDVCKWLESKNIEKSIVDSFSGMSECSHLLSLLVF